jgi:hypothetical protein
LTAISLTIADFKRQNQVSTRCSLMSSTMSTALSTLLSLVSYNVLHCYAPLAFNSRL